MGVARDRLVGAAVGVAVTVAVGTGRGVAVDGGVAVAVGVMVGNGSVIQGDSSDVFPNGSVALAVTASPGLRVSGTTSYSTAIPVGLVVSVVVTSRRSA